MATQEFTVTTIAARIKFAAAHETGAAVPKVTHVGWGDGGHDIATGNPKRPTGEETIVPGEFIKKPIDGVSRVGTITTYQISLAGTDSQGNGKNVSSCGLYDESGTLLTVKNFNAKPKEDSSVSIDMAWKENF